MPIEPQIILGSASPRRVEIMQYFRIPFVQQVPRFNESSLPFRDDPIAYVKALAAGKADSLASVGELPLLTADTIVYRDGATYGKPKSQVEAIETLNTLSGKWHSVFTALCLDSKGRRRIEVEETRVQFSQASPDQIVRYVEQVPYQDKAGAYLIQEAGAIMVRRIEGCYYNVVGLPIALLAELLREIEIDLWDCLA